MIRPLLLLSAATCALSASAAPLFTTDLPGLVLEADDIVLAERVDAGVYVIDHALVGAAAAGEALELIDGSYEADSQVMLFLTRDPRGIEAIVPGGLMPLRGGYAFHASQWSNPGGYRAHPLELDESLGVDLDRLTTEIQTLKRLTPRLEALATEPDIARRRFEARALLRPLPDWCPHEFIDVWSRRVLLQLIAAGDLEGALSLAHRDSSTAQWLGPFASQETLLRFAEDPRRPGWLRGRAVQWLGQDVRADLEKLAPRLVKLLRDASPQVRMQTVELMRSQLQVERLARAPLAELYRVEKSPRVAFELLLSFGRRPPPERTRSSSLGVWLKARARGLQANFLAQTPARPTRLLIQTPEGPKPYLPAVFGTDSPFQANVRGLQRSEGERLELTAGRYPLALELLDPEDTTELALGTLVVDVDGTWSLE